MDEVSQTGVVIDYAGLIERHRWLLETPAGRAHEEKMRLQVAVQAGKMFEENCRAAARERKRSKRYA